MRSKSSSLSRRTEQSPLEGERERGREGGRENPLVQQFIPLCLVGYSADFSDLNAGHHSAHRTPSTKAGRKGGGKEGSSLLLSLSSPARARPVISPRLRDPITFKWPEIERFRREREREREDDRDRSKTSSGVKRVAPRIASYPVCLCMVRRCSDAQIYSVEGCAWSMFVFCVPPTHPWQNW